MVRLEDLIWHPSDSAVIPIVANRRIERIAEPQFDAAALPFPPLVCPSASHIRWRLVIFCDCVDMIYITKIMSTYE